MKMEEKKKKKMEKKNQQTINKRDFKETVFESLLEINDCPKSLNYYGKIFKKENYKLLTIVGSRMHSRYAKDALEKIFKALRGQPVVIVSGMALGIDALAHKLALKNGLKTIAVVGSGLGEKILYPRSNIGLAKDILSKGGLIVSEYDSDFKATGWSFPQRNRIMVGISEVVLVVEAKEKSGTAITARLTLEYNRELTVIPNSIFSEFSTGSNKLLRTGANPILDGQDLLNILGINEEERMTQQKFNPKDLSDLEKKIMKKLVEPKSKEELLKELKINITELNTTLSMLEIKNYISESLGKYRKNF